MKNELGFIVVGVVALFAAVGCASEVTEGSGAAGGGGEGGSGGTGGSVVTGTTSTVTGPSFAEVYTKVLEPRSCTSGYCHGSFDGNLIAEMHATYLGILGGIADGEGCGNAKLVIPGDPENSMLYLKVSMTKPPCGERMPFSNVVLPASEIELIRAWIAAGAHE